MKTTIRNTILAGLLTALATPLQAGDPYTLPPQETSDGGDWEFSLGMFGWLTSVEGDVGPAGSVAPVDVEFGDILDALDMTILANLEVRRGRWFLLSTLTYLELSADDSGGGLLFDRVSLEMDQTILSLWLAYRVLEGPTSVDVMAGARYMSIGTDIGFQGGTRDGTEASEDADWIDPLIGVRISHDFSEKWHGQLRADVGGFGVSSDLAWEVFAGVGYHITDSIQMYGGYRYLNVDHDRSYVFDAETQGVVIGANFRF